MTAVISHIRMRRTDELDRDAILAMYERCSEATRFARWHGHTPGIPHAYLDGALEGAEAHHAFVVESGDDVIGLGSAVLIGPTTREIGLLVEDGWQGRGFGRQLVAELAAASVAAGTRHWRIEMLLADVHALRLFRGFGDVRRTTSYGRVVASLDLFGGSAAGHRDEPA